MIISKLPYFLKMIKHNIIISSLITTGNFNIPELKNSSYEIVSKDAIELNNYALSPIDSFEQVSFSRIRGFTGKYKETTIVLTLTTKNSKYFQNPVFYFDNQGSKLLPSEINDTTVKRFGFFKLFGNQVPVDVSIKHSPVYGYMIMLFFYPNYREILKTREKFRTLLKGKD